VNELTPAQLAYRYRMVTLTTGENGKPFNSSCPPNKHGTSVGASYWGCRCDPCVEYINQASRDGYARKKHNRLVLQALEYRRQNGSSSETAPEGSAVATLPGAEDPAAPPAVDPPADPPEHPMEAFAKAYRQRFWKTD
jgi:hypothetical protein